MVQVIESGTLVDAAAVQELHAVHRGPLICPGDAEYEEARQVWNAMIDRHPAVIARCVGAADVIAAVNFARDRGLVISVRGGAHNVPGTAVCDGGLVIDCSSMKSIRVDPVRCTARAEPGVKWGEFDVETQAFGLATTGGTFSDTGIAGLTLGGGVGWLGPRYGLASDNLISVDVVTADGQLLCAREDENADLFWALRGGGGNFGVVTSFEYRLHKVGPLLGGLVVHPFSRAKEALEFYRDFSAAMPDELATAFGFLTHPEAGPCVGMVAVWNGPIEEGEGVLRPLREFGPPVDDQIAVVPYTAVQTMMDPLAPPRRYYYAKGLFMNEFSDPAIETMIANFGKVSSPLSMVIIQYKGGEMARGAPDRTAFGHRDARHLFVIFPSWEDPTESDRHLKWSRTFGDEIAPFCAGGEYVNDLGLQAEDGSTRIREAFGANYNRLAQIKNKYDPTNLFRHNQNIQPSI